MILNEITDPRDNLERAKLMELVRFANANGLKHVTYDMPAILIRAELRSRGMTNIKVPPRPLGSLAASHTMAAAPEQNIIEVQAVADLARQYAQQQPAAARSAKPEKPKRLVERPRQEINVLRDECKRLGIPMGRRDTKADLKAKIAAHGQNPA